MPTDLLVVIVVAGAVAAFCLGWMLFNLVKVVIGEGLSGDFSKRMEQTKAILLKPALLFFGVGIVASVYMALRNAGVSQ